MKYIILINKYEKLDQLNLKYKYINFLKEDDNTSNINILFSLKYDNIRDYDNEYNLHNIISDSDIDDILSDYNILNIYYDKIYFLYDNDNSKIEYNNFNIEVDDSFYNDNISQDTISQDNTISENSLNNSEYSCDNTSIDTTKNKLKDNISNFTEEILLIINFYIYSIKKSIKYGYDDILLLISPIFCDNFENIFKNSINKKKYNDKIILFNKFTLNINDIGAISIKKVIYDELLEELNKINNYLLPNLTDIIRNNYLVFSDDHDIILKNNLINIENYININNLEYFSCIHNSINICDIIKILNINQIYLSKSLYNHRHLFSQIGNNLKYVNKNEPVLIYGVYRENEIEVLNNHKGIIYIYWHDNDCNPNYRARRNIVKEIILNNRIKYHICNKIQTSKYLNYFKIKPLFINSKNNNTNIQNLNNNNNNNNEVNFNEYFDKIFVINLETETHKKKLIDLKFKEADIKYEFFSAVNGWEEPHLQEYRLYKKKPYNWKGSHYLERNLKRKVIRSPGAYGYLKTWEKIILYAIDNNLSKICVFDDDVLIDYSFHKKFNDFILNIKSNWAVINLGSTQYGWNDVKVKNNYYLTPTNTDGSFAVCLKSDTFKYLLKQIRLFNCSFDSGSMRYLFKEFSNHCYTLYPAIVIADVCTSSIGSSRDFFDFSKTMRWNLNNINYSKYLNVLVSVIVPMYNAEETIRLCMDSIINQTYRTIEIIVVDDSSTDNSNNIIKNEYVDKFDNIKLIETESNSGCYAARNIGIKNCRGSYIIFHDADDISLNDKIETQINLMLENKLLICGCNFTRLQDKINLQNYKNIDTYISKNKIYGGRFALVTLMYKRSVFKNIGLFREDYRHSMDNEFVERFIFKFFKKKFSMPVHTMLDRNDKSLHEIYYKVNKLLYVSTPVTSNNISIKYKRSQRESIKDSYIKNILENKIKYSFL